jgi:hypothetical protein
MVKTIAQTYPADKKAAETPTQGARITSVDGTVISTIEQVYDKSLTPMEQKAGGYSGQIKKVGTDI